MNKKLFKKAAVLLVTLILVCAFNLTASAADSYTSGYWTYEFGTYGLTITGYSGRESTVTIPSELNGYKVGAIGKQAFQNNVTMRTVTIPESITYIGPEAFYKCAGLSQINFNAKNCTVPEIWRYDSDRGVGVFSGAGSAATSLNVTFGANVTNIPTRLFDTDHESGYDYAHVTSVTFSSGVKTIGDNAFADCRDLAKVTLGSNITTIGTAAFQDCVSISTVTFKDSLATIGENAFENCTGLTSITWGGGLDTIGNYAFKGCTSLEEAIIPKPTTTIGIQAFADNTSLTKISIPSTVTSVKAEAFYNTIKLSKINFNAKNCTIPDVWRYDDNKGVGVFSGAGSASPSGLKVTFASTVKAVPSGLFNTDRENGYAYAYVTDISFNSSVTEIGTYAFQNCESIESVTFGSGVTTIGEYAFDGCLGIKKITFKDKLTTIGANAFLNCTGLETITWGDGLDTIGDYAFKGCTSLKAAKIPKPTTVIGIQAFADNTSLTTVTIPSTVTTIKAEAFYNTTKLSTVTYNAKECTIPEIWRYDDNKGVGLFSGAGSGASSFKVTFGSTVTLIPANLFNTDYENGYDYAYVTSVTIPSSVKEIGVNAFEDCMNLTAVTCKRSSLTIGENAYKNCPTNLKFTCYYGSTTASFAKDNGFKHTYLKPTKPDLVKATNTSKGIKITWEKSTGAYKYMIYRKTSSSGSWSKIDSIKASTGKLYYVDDSVSSGKTYYYTVKAYTSGGLYSSYDTTGLKLERLKAPTSVTLTNTKSGIKVAWKKSTGAEKYYVYRSKNGGSYIKVATVTGTSYTDTSSKGNGNKFQYKVYAYDSGSISASSSVKKTYRLGTPTISSLTSSSSGKLTVKWGKNSGATGYKIQYSTSSSFSNSKTITVSGKSTVSKTISGLTKGKKYYVRVRAYKTVSGTTYYSAWSSSLSKTTKK